MMTATRLIHRQFTPNHNPHIRLDIARNVPRLFSTRHAQGVCNSTSTAASLNHRMHRRTEEYLQDTLLSLSVSAIGTARRGFMHRSQHRTFYRHSSAKTVPQSTSHSTRLTAIASRLCLYRLLELHDSTPSVRVGRSVRGR
jgi:hypothetical protein